MKRIIPSIALALLATAPAGFAGLIFQIAATNRVDTVTQVTLTYTVTAAADVGTQNVGSYFTRAVFGTLPVPAGSLDLLSGITRAPDNTPFGPSVTGPFTIVSVTPSLGQIRWLADSSTGQNVVIDTAGALIGTFNLTWNRPATGQYDAAIPATFLTGGYRVAPFDQDTEFTPGTTVAGTGVSTIVAAIPEPNSSALLGAGMLVAGVAHWLRNRKRTVN